VYKAQRRALVQTRTCSHLLGTLMAQYRDSGKNADTMTSWVPPQAANPYVQSTWYGANTVIKCAQHCIVEAARSRLCMMKFRATLAVRVALGLYCALREQRRLRIRTIQISPQFFHAQKRLRSFTIFNPPAKPYHVRG
jgi:hypothetical protein